MEYGCIVKSLKHCVLIMHAEQIKSDTSVACTLNNSKHDSPQNCTVIRISCVHYLFRVTYIPVYLESGFEGVFEYINLAF